MVLVNPPVSPICSIAVPGSGAPSGGFTVANVPSGTYTIIATGFPENDFATAGLLVYSTAAPEPPISTTVSLVIYIPPEFTGLTIGNVWTSFTNDYNPNSIRLSRQSSADETGPNWWEINVQNIIVTNTPSHYFRFGPLVSQRIFTVNQTQYVRLFQVTSPTTAGRYFFKAFINGASIGAENFPTLVVKGSRDPATISGTLRDLGNRNPYRAGKPIYLSPGEGAEVIANGYNALGESVSAQTFINSTADGEYTLFGVAPGTYNMTVYAAGYVPITITQFPYPYPFLPSVVTPTPISVAPAQSLEGIDIFLSESPNVTGTVLSQTAQGAPIQWGTVTGLNGVSSNRSITVELINIVDGTTVIATNQQPFTLPSTYVCNTVTNCATNPSATDYDFTIQNQLSSWSGEIPQNYANFTSGLPTGVDYFVRAYVTSYVQLAEIRAHRKRHSRNGTAGPIDSNRLH
ncbi:MAG TPA: carboxypeptidase-like regulatory domain-containing protein [Candidatus Acidoferrales bacterium]|nr:carboxypeptidase-like regulatory domain-containing protein [Candidatus Acidoferrales bacterium]